MLSRNAAGAPCCEERALFASLRTEEERSSSRRQTRQGRGTWLMRGRREMGGRVYTEAVRPSSGDST